jgi:hypothetical protein
VARSFRESHHLPKRRDGGRPPDPYELPRQRRGVTPQMHGRYPDYDVLEQAEHWDAETRRIVLSRLSDPPPIRFFTAAEAAVLAAFCDTVTAQDADPKVPVLPIVDQKLYEHRLEGYQYADMPDDRDTWRLVAQGLDEAAGRRGIASFALASPQVREDICAGFARGELAGGVWDVLPVSRAWQVVMRDVLAAFYAHPFAWNEIGYAGPAYPRGFMRLGIDDHEPFEAREAYEIDPVQDVEERGLE